MAQPLALLQSAFSRVRSMTVAELLACGAGVVFTVGGNAGMLIVLNQWMTQFPPNATGPFTVLSLVSTFSTLCFSLLFLGRVLITRPALGFLKDLRASVFAVVAGAMLAWNGVTVVQATPGTPEVLQALLVSTGMFWTFALTVVADRCRGACRFVSPWVLFAFLSCLGGIALGMANTFTGSGAAFNKPGVVKWTCVFAVGQVFSAAQYVVSAKYLRRVTASEDPVVRLVQPEGVTDGTTAKIALCALTNISQVVFVVLSFPLDFLPGFGPAATPAVAWAELRKGWECVFFQDAAHPYNFWFFAMFLVCFGCNLIGTNMLSFYSAPLTTMVSQLSSPISAVILLAIPALAVSSQAQNVWEQLGAVALITTGVVVYTVWEQREKAHEAEELRVESYAAAVSTGRLGALDAGLLKKSELEDMVDQVHSGGALDPVQKARLDAAAVNYAA